MLRRQTVTIFGDGEQTRDFVHVADVAQANYRAAISPSAAGAFNIGSAHRISISELARVMTEIVGGRFEVLHGAPRPGDVRDSLAKVEAAGRAFGYEPSMDLEVGLRDYIKWLRTDEVTRERWSACQ